MIFRALISPAKLFYFFVFLLIFVPIVFIYQYTHRTCRDCNIILISIDTLRPDHMGLYGYGKNTTPTIDSLANKSIVFENMRTQVPATFPSFTALMTGISPFDSGIYNNSFIEEVSNPIGGKQIPTSTRTLAEILKSRGYVTKAYMTNFQLEKVRTNINQGFDSYEYLNKFSEPQEKYDNFLNKSARWITKNKDKKFFLWVHLMDPHPPYAIDGNLACKFTTKEQCSVIQSEGMEKLEELRASLQGCPRDTKATKEQVDLIQALYDAGIFQSDQYVNMLLKEILKNKIGNKTIVIIYGDHGEGFDHDFNFAHGHSLYESGLRIPVIIRYPTLHNKLTISSMGTNANLFDIILYLLQSATVNESSITSLLFQKGDSTMFAINTEATKFSITNSKYKYIYSVLGSCPVETERERLKTLELPIELRPTQREELFDIQLDPNETKDLKKTLPQAVSSLRLLLFEYLNAKNVEIPRRLSASKEKTKQDEDVNNMRNLGY